MLRRHRKRLCFGRRYRASTRSDLGIRKRFASTSPFEASYQLRDWWDAFLEEYGRDYFSFQDATVVRTALEETATPVLLTIVEELMQDRTVEFDYPTTRGPMDVLIIAAIANTIVESEEFKQMKE